MKKTLLAVSLLVVSLILTGFSTNAFAHGKYLVNEEKMELALGTSNGLTRGAILRLDTCKNQEEQCRWTYKKDTGFIQSEFENGGLVVCALDDKEGAELALAPRNWAVRLGPLCKWKDLPNNIWDNHIYRLQNTNLCIGIASEFGVTLLPKKEEKKCYWHIDRSREPKKP